MTLLAALLASSCNLDPEPPQLPPLRVVSTVPEAVDGGVATQPAGPPLSITFNRLLAPSTIHGGTVQVTSGAIGVFGGLRYDVIRRRVEFIPDARAFRRTIQYEFAIRGDLRAWDGAPLANPAVIRFVAGDAVTPPARPTRTLSRDVAPLLAARCATAGCHVGAEPAMGLDLSSAGAIVRTALRVASRERPAPGPAGASPGDPRWGAMLRIDPGVSPQQGRPEYSYLVYKILGDGPVIGARMPPDGPPLSDEESAAVADWIALGAPVN